MAANKILPIALVSAGLFLVAKTANAANAVRNLKVTRAKISNVKIVLLGIDLTMLLEISNPSSVNIPFEYYTGSIIYSGSKLADFTFNGNGKNIVLTQRVSTPVSFVVTLSTPAVISKIVGIIKDISFGKPVNTIFNINGSVYAAGLDVPVSFTYDIRPGAVNGLSEIGKFRLRNLSPVASLVHKLRSKKKARRLARRNPAPQPLQLIAPPATTAPVYTTTTEPVITTAPVIVPPAVDNGSGWAGN